MNPFYFFHSLTSLLLPPAFSFYLAVGKQEQHRQFFLGLESVRSFYQLLVSDTASNRGINKTIQPVQSMTLNIAIIQAESELINITCKMLFAGMM